MSHATEPRSAARRIGPAGILVLFAILARGLLVGLQEPAMFWDSQSYIDAMHSLHDLSIPRIGIRTLGYPLFLAICGTPAVAVIVQQVLGVLSTLVLFLLARRLIGSEWVAFAVAAAFTLSVDLLFMETAIYAEPLTIFLLLSALHLFVRALQDRARPAAWFAAGLTVAALAITRPVFQLLVGMLVVWLLLELRLCLREGRWIRRKLERLGFGVGELTLRSALMFTLAPIVILGSYGVFGWFDSGRFRIAIGTGFSSLNYVGRPEIYRHLPPELSWIREVYETAAESMAEPDPYLGWGPMLQPVLEARRRQGFEDRHWDDACFDTFRRAVSSVPAQYLSVWSQVLCEFAADHQLVYGFYPDFNTPHVRAEARVSGYAYSVVIGIKGVWTMLQPALSWIAFASWLLFLILILRAPSARERQRQLLLVSLGLALCFHVLASTAIEPSPGQHRYRMSWSGVILLLAGAVGVSVCRGRSSQIEPE